MDIRITSETLSIPEEVRAFETSAIGAGGTVTFAGHVRAEGGMAAVATLHLQHFPGRTEASMAAIGEAATRHWPVEALTIVHRVGDMAPGDAIVFVAVAARHRRDAFEACDYVMDHLKSRALFWKRETTAEGARWVETREADAVDLARWGELAVEP